MKNHLKSLFILCSLILSCQSDDDVNDSTSLQLATIESQTTIDNAQITFTTIKIEGNITSNGGSTVIESGICWSTSPNPTTDNEIKIENSDVISTTIDNLTANTDYYFRVYATNEVGTSYGPEISLKTLNLADTNWIFTTYYSEVGDFSIVSEINFYADQTTRYDELDLPLQCPGCFITYGSWTLDGNNLTYIWEGDDPNNSTYVYTGILLGMSMEGTYTHQTSSDGFWTAIPE
jgi:hypothetical protein